MQTELRARELMKMGLNVKIMLIGKKGATYFKRRSEIFNIAGVLQSLQGKAVGQLGAAGLPGLLGTPWPQRGLQSRWGKAAVTGRPLSRAVFAQHGRRCCSGSVACMHTRQSAPMNLQHTAALT